MADDGKKSAAGPIALGVAAIAGAGVLVYGYLNGWFGGGGWAVPSEFDCAGTSRTRKWINADGTIEWRIVEPNSVDCDGVEPDPTPTPTPTPPECVKSAECGANQLCVGGVCVDIPDDGSTGVWAEPAEYKCLGTSRAQKWIRNDGTIEWRVIQVNSEDCAAGSGGWAVPAEFRCWGRDRQRKWIDNSGAVQWLTVTENDSVCGATLSGRVTNWNGTVGLQGAVLTLDGVAGDAAGKHYIRTSDENGYLPATTIEAGSYNYTITLAGYIAGSGTLLVGGETALDIRMTTDTGWVMIRARVNGVGTVPTAIRIDGNAVALPYSCTR